MDRHAWTYSFLIAALVALGAFGFYQYDKVTQYETAVQNAYQRSFYELVQYVDDIESSLSKSVLAYDPKQMVQISSDIYRYASSARANLGELPTMDTSLDGAAKFLAQVGDYTYTLSLKHLDNSPVTEEETRQLASFTEYAKKMGESLSGMQQNMFSGGLNFLKASAQASDVSDGFANVERGFQEYPSLIYDGPFSDHIENMTPQALENRRAITQEEALAKLKGVLGEKGKNLVPAGETKGKIPVYQFRADLGGRSIYAEVTQREGYLLNLLDSRQLGDAAIALDKAKEIAAAFLNQCGFYSMTESYYELQNNVLTINYAYSQDGVMIYPDLVKVKVAMDNGEIMGIESHGYIMNHKEGRDLSGTLLTKEQATEKIGKLMQVEKVNMAVIPTPANGEKLCYEVKGKYNDREFLVYVNAKTGAQENILMLLVTEGGTLTI